MTFYIIVSIIGLLTTGAASALLRKVLFQMPAPGLGGSIHPFKKPFFTTFDSAIACTTALGFQYISLRLQRRALHKQQQHKQAQQGEGDGEDGYKAPLLGGQGQEEAQEVACMGRESQMQRELQVLSSDPVIEAALSFNPLTKRLLLLLLWPALLGRMALIIQGMGLKYVSASMNQMVAASCIVFTAILSVTFMKKQLNQHHIMGILLVLCGITIVSFAHEIFNLLAGLFSGVLIAGGTVGGTVVGIAGGIVGGTGDVQHVLGVAASAFLPNGEMSMMQQQSTVNATTVNMLTNSSAVNTSDLLYTSTWLTNTSSTWLDTKHHKHHHPHPTRAEVALGIGLILLSQLVQAGQLVLEEVLLGGQGALEPMEVIGWEGLLSVGWMVGMFLPLAQILPGNDVGGVLENTVDSVIMLTNSPSLCMWNAVYLVTVIGTNVFGLLVASTLGSVFRAVLLAARTGLVWIAALIIHALGVGGGQYGEVWDACSWIVLAGFIMLLTGTVMYAQGSSKVVRVSELHPHDEVDLLHERLKSYTILGTNRTAEDYGLFDDLLDRDSFEQQVLSGVGHAQAAAIIAPRMSSHGTPTSSIAVPGSSPRAMLRASSRRRSILGDERLSAPLRGLLHSTSWIKDEEDRWADREHALKARLSSRGGDGV